MTHSSSRRRDGASYNGINWFFPIYELNWHRDKQVSTVYAYVNPEYLDLNLRKFLDTLYL